jgi:hypothetical protein
MEDQSKYIERIQNSVGTVRSMFEFGLECSRAPWDDEIEQRITPGTLDKLNRGCQSNLFPVRVKAQQIVDSQVSLQYIDPRSY